MVSSGGNYRGVDVMLPLVMGIIARLGFEHVWPVSVGRRHDDWRNWVKVIAESLNWKLAIDIKSNQPKEK